MRERVRIRQEYLGLVRWFFLSFLFYVRFSFIYFLKWPGLLLIFLSCKVSFGCGNNIINGRIFMCCFVLFKSHLGFFYL